MDMDMDARQQPRKGARRYNGYYNNEHGNTNATLRHRGKTIYNFNKNIYLKHLRSQGSTTGGYDKLNSTVTQLSNINEIELLMNRSVKPFQKKVNVDYLIPNTNIKITREIFIF
ncbi:hypothetical protein DMUE_4007 [Dictyocoela muelleri]|nr:hypothetical protein DMUE_4007 [Dictyocoela muelleri]